MDPVINGLSLESPCKPSLGMALLINPERNKGTITSLMAAYSFNLTEQKEKIQDDTFTRGSFSAEVRSANGSLHHVICAFQLMTSSRATSAFPGVLYSFWKEENVFGFF